MPHETVHVIVASPIDGKLVKQIEAVKDCVHVQQASPLILAERKGDFSRREHLTALLKEAQVICGLIYHFPQNLLERAPHLEWIQTMSAGVDRLPAEIMESPVRIASASGLHGTPVAEVVLEMMLMFAKDAPACLKMKEARKWSRYRPKFLRGQTVGIVGLGVIGQEITRLCKVFGMRVVGTRRTGGGEPPSADVDRFYPRGQLEELLAESDFVVLALPLTRETRGLIGERELRSMKPSAYLINVARGAIVDEEALIRALEEKWIAGTGLDVFVKEPLPSESKFFDLPNVIYSPHISGDMPDYDERATEVFCENLRRYIAGEPFLHEVDKEKGY